MKPLVTKISSYIFTILVFFTVLFDPTSIALGTSVITLPNFLLVLAEILGNLLWLFGLLFWVIAVVFGIVLFKDGLMTDTINKSLEMDINLNVSTPYDITDKYGNPVYHRLTRKKIAFKWFTGIGATIAVGSGFWFTGTGWLLAVILGIIYNNSCIERAEEIIKENNMSKKVHEGEIV